MDQQPDTVVTETDEQTTLEAPDLSQSTETNLNENMEVTDEVKPVEEKETAQVESETTKEEVDLKEQEAVAEIAPEVLEEMLAEPTIENATVDELIAESEIVNPVESMAVSEETPTEAVAATTNETQVEDQDLPDDKKVNTQKPKPKSGTFSLGVPGLTFSSQNLKVASDGTKMVQIHQSQITPDQLQALQSNPNIKVVFRHIPTGKSFTKPPKNLFSCLSKQQGVKRKSSSDHGNDDSIYNFDDDFDRDYADTSRPKGSISKYARYTPNIGMKKRGPGRPRLIPDAHTVTSGLTIKPKPPAIPTQIMLTDALSKLNNPRASNTVKIHIKQVTHDILANMELNPDYNLVLTAKHDLPPEHSLEELVKEWEEKEVEQQVEHIEQKEIDTMMQEESSMEESMMDEDFLKEEPRVQFIENEEDEMLLAEQQRLREEQKEREEAELLAAAMQEKKSRSGRIRKPSRYSLDIARLTKRRNVVDDASPDEDFVVTPPKPVLVKTPKSDISTPGGKKRGRGRPRKVRPEEDTTPTTSSMDDSEVKTMVEKVETAASPEHKKPEPMVIMSPSDKKLAETIRLKDQPDAQTDGTAESPKPTTSTENTDAEIKEMDIDAQMKQKDDLEKPDEDKKTVQPDEPAEQDEKMDVSESVSKTEDKAESGKENDTPEKSDPEDKAAADKTQTIEADTTDKVMDDEIEKSEDSKDPEKSTEVKEEMSSESKETGSDEKTEKQTETKDETSQPERKVSSDGETPSDVIARKLSAQEEGDKPEQPVVAKEKAEQKPELKDFVEEEGDVDNKYRLRKLLQQCTIDEIRSVAIPRALDAITIGDFFLHKAGQMASEKVKFVSLYKQLENLHTAIEKESVRYNTLLRRANKVGGDRRMDKVILMPIYNKKAAESIHISSSSIDAHIGGISQKSTAQMIAANSFRMNCKMEPPVHRLRLPDLADKNQLRNKRRQLQHKYNRHPEPDSTTPDHPNQRNLGRLPGNLHANNWKKSPYQVRKPSYLLGSGTGGTAHSTLQEQARMQLVGRYQSQLVVSKEPTPVSASVVDSSTSALTTDNANLVSQSSEITSAGNVIDLNQDLLTSQQVVDGQAAQVVNEDGSPVIAAEEGKQLVAIGDGQYVELPEGYTLIQTDDGYIIGQPGATFVQGEDGNVYMTSTEDGTEANTQVLTTTAPIGETPSTDALLDQLGQT